MGWDSFFHTMPITKGSSKLGPLIERVAFSRTGKHEDGQDRKDEGERRRSVHSNDYSLVAWGALSGNQA